MYKTPAKADESGHAMRTHRKIILQRFIIRTGDFSNPEKYESVAIGTSNNLTAITSKGIN
jgi:hypothetical protein